MSDENGDGVHIVEADSIQEAAEMVLNEEPCVDLQAARSRLANALRLLNVLKNYSEQFTVQHAGQLEADVSAVYRWAAKREAMDRYAQDEPSGPPVNLIDLVNQLPVGGRITLERSR